MSRTYMTGPMCACAHSKSPSYEAPSKNKMGRGRILGSGFEKVVLMSTTRRLALLPTSGGSQLVAIHKEEEKKQINRTRTDRER